MHHCDSWRIKDQLDVTYFTSYVLNMFRTLIYPSSGACDYSVELPHWSYCSWFDVCCSFGVVGLEWYPCCRLIIRSWRPHRNSNTHRTQNNTTNMVIQPNSRKLLIMDILMSETCWAHKKWNKIASDIKLIFYSSTIIFGCCIANFCSACRSRQFLCVCNTLNTKANEKGLCYLTKTAFHRVLISVVIFAYSRFSSFCATA